MNATITTQLLSDSPRGIKQAWMRLKTCRCVYLTRKDLTIAKTIAELDQPALYLLFGKEDKKEVYIGQTINFNQRIIKHDNKKIFWNEVLVFTSIDDSFGTSDILYLEYLALKKAKKSKNYTLKENKQNPTEPILAQNEKEILEEFFKEQIIFLSSFLNFNIFDNYKDIKEEEILFCSKNNIKAKGFYDDNKFIVLENSKITKDAVNSYNKSSKKEERENVLAEKCVEEDNYFLLKENIEFSSPSAASSFCLGNSSNGWITWKDKSGKTMADIYR